MTESHPEPRTALVIDDEGPIRRVVRRFLERSGWRVEEAEDGAAATRLLLASDGRAYDLVICDVNLPERSGVELWRELRERKPALAARFVLSTGESAGGSGRLDAESAHELALAGRMLAKPFSLEDLNRLLGTLAPAAAA